MPTMKVDLSDTKTFEPPTEGDYLGTIVACEPGTTGSGFPKVDVRWEVEDQGVTKTIFQTVAIGGEGAFRAEQLFIAIGLANTREEVQGMEFDPTELLGLQAVLTIKHRIWSEEEGGDNTVRGNVQKMKRADVAAQSGGSGIFGRR